MTEVSTTESAPREVGGGAAPTTTGGAVEPRQGGLDAATPRRGEQATARGGREVLTSSEEQDVAAGPAPKAERPEQSAAGGQHDAEYDRYGGSERDRQPTLVQEVEALRARWESVQVSFVDDPRRAVSDAESLVSDVIDDMTAGFRHQRDQLESLWSNGQEASTEQLRQAIQRYREFFERFLRV